MCMSGYSNMVLNADLFQDVSLQGDRSLRWPLWLRAAIPGTISLYFTIYYEMENVSSIMKYRTLRMHYSLQVRNLISTLLICFFLPNFLLCYRQICIGQHIWTISIFIYIYIGFTISRDLVWNHPLSIKIARISCAYGYREPCEFRFFRNSSVVNSWVSVGYLVASACWYKLAFQVYTPWARFIMFLHD